MAMRRGMTRRGFLKGLGIGAGAAMGTRFAGGLSGFIGDAQAATNGAAVVVVHLNGGFNSLFVSPDSFAPAGTFGVRAGNYTLLGNGVAIDNTWNSALSTYAKQHLAVLGVRHGISSHEAAQRADWSFNGTNAALVLANAIGGTASIKAAVVGTDLDSDLPNAPVNGIGFQRINDLRSTIDALGLAASDPRKPDRAIALPIMTQAQSMASADLAANPKSLSSVDLGYKAAVDTLSKTTGAINLTQIQTAYGLGTTTTVSSFRSKLAAAEVMVRAGTNVVAMFDGGWDTHGDVDGVSVRNKMTTYVMSPIATFINRMIDPAQNAAQNVNLIIIGDFARSLPGSDHQPNLSVAVFGKNVVRGTTGRVGANVSLPSGTPGVTGMWSYLAAASKVATNPFGANPHGLVL
jgi:hypothetical protein